MRDEADSAMRLAIEVLMASLGLVTLAGLLSLCAGCGGFAYVTRHQVSLIDDRVPPEHVDRTVDLLDEECRLSGLTDRAARIIANELLWIRWDEVATDCDPVLAGYPAGTGVDGCIYGRRISVMTRPCLADSALTHEFAHRVAARALNDSDPYHVNGRLWAVVGNANARLREELCK